MSDWNNWIYLFDNKTPGGINVGYVGRSLQSLWFYVKNDKFNIDSSKYGNEIENKGNEKMSLTL